jgi:hypothetical protein
LIYVALCFYLCMFYYLKICTVLIFVVFVSKVLFLLFRSFFVCSICKFMHEFVFDSRWVEVYYLLFSLVICLRLCVAKKFKEVSTYT